MESERRRRRYWLGPAFITLLGIFVAIEGLAHKREASVAPWPLNSCTVTCLVQVRQEQSSIRASPTAH